MLLLDLMAASSCSTSVCSQAGRCQPVAVDGCGLRSLSVDEANLQPPAVTQSMDLLGETMAGKQHARSGKSASLIARRVEGSQGRTALAVPCVRRHRRKLRQSPSDVEPITPSSGPRRIEGQRFATQTRLAAAFGKDHSEQLPDEMWRADPPERSRHDQGTPRSTWRPKCLPAIPASSVRICTRSGAVLYELCVGKPPQHVAPELHRMVTNIDAAPLASVVPSIDPRFARLIDHRLVFDPGARFQSAVSCAKPWNT